MQTVTYAPGPTASISREVCWLLNTTTIKLHSFLFRTLLDWLMLNYPHYTEKHWATSPALRYWWVQQWFLYDARFLDELRQVDFRERWEWYRMLHQYPFSHRDNKAAQLLADFETHWPQYEKEIEADEKVSINA